MVDFKTLRTAFRAEYPDQESSSQTDLLLFQLIKAYKNEPITIPVDASVSSTIRLVSPVAGSEVVAGIPFEIFATSSLPKSVGKVEFYVGTTKIGEDRTPPYSTVFTPQSVGSVGLKAVAVSPDGTTQVQSETVTINVVASPTPIVANQPPTVSLVNPSSVTAGQTVTLSANASDPDGQVAKVEFYQGSTKLGEDVTEPYQQSWTPAAGSYVLTAIAIDNKGAATTSTAINATVAAASGGGGTPTTFNRVFVFTAGNSGALQGGGANNTGCTANAAQSTNTQFRFNEIATRIGTPANMTIHINGTAFLSFNYPNDYEGRPFVLVGADGTVFPQRNITSGRVDLP